MTTVRVPLAAPWRRHGAGLRRAAGLAALGAASMLLAASIALAAAGVRGQLRAGDGLPAGAPISGAVSGLLGSASATLDSLERPLDVSVDALGRVYVLGGPGQRWVRSFDAAGRPLSSFEIPGTLSAPGAAYLASGPDGLIYVGDRATASVLAFDAQGTLMRRLTSPLADGWLPLGVAFDDTGDLYVTDVTPGRHRVLKLDRAGRLLWAAGLQGSGPSQFAFPADVAVDSRGRVYVSDSNNGRVQVLDEAGSFLQLLPAGGRSLEPRGLALDGSRLYVVSTSRHEVLVYDVSGEPQLISRLSGGADPASGLSYPNGVAVAPGGRVYVADRGGNRVLAWDP